MSGKLWKDALVMYDHQTNSYWSHVIGEAIQGELTGRQLNTYPAVQTTWAAWSGSYPDTRVLEKPRLSGSVYARYEEKPDQLGIFGRQLNRSRLAGKEKIVGFIVDARPFATPLAKLTPGTILLAEINGVPLIFYTDVSGLGVSIWRRKSSDLLQLSLSADAPQIAESAAGQKWDLISGRNLKDGTQLEPVQSTLAYWFGWHNFYPATVILIPQESIDQLPH